MNPQATILMQVDHVRAQIPLMGGRSPTVFGANSPHQGLHHHHHHMSGGTSPLPHHHHHHCGEHMIKIRYIYFKAVLSPKNVPAEKLLGTCGGHQVRHM